MGPGKIPNHIVARSVFKNIHNKNKNLDFGRDAVLMEETLISTNPIKYGIEYIEYDIIKAINNILVQGGTPLGLVVNVIWTRDFNENSLKNVIKRIDKM